MPGFRPIVVLLSLVACAGSLSSRNANSGELDWSQFRGMRGNGLAAQSEEPPISFGLDQNLAWQRKLAPGCSSPCIYGDRVFLTAHRGWRRCSDVEQCG